MVLAKNKEPSVKKKVENIIKKLIGLLPLHKTIIFESNPDLACNTYPVFKYMLDKGLNKNHKMIWLVNNKDMYKDWNIDNVSYVNINPVNFFNRITLVYLRATSKVLIFSNRILGKLNPKQLSIFLAHGSYIKKTKGIYEINDSCDFVLYQSEFIKKITASEYNVNLEKLVCLGYPRNDYLYDDVDAMSQLFGNIKFKKMVMWLPTFRQHKNGRTDSKANFILGIPVLESEKMVEGLNTYLEELEILLVLKPHPAQDTKFLRAKKLSNFLLLDDELLAINKTHLYQLLGQSDALITDYSSVYYDYLLTDKPIGLTIDDIQSYEKNRGFVFEKPLDILKGEYIKSSEDLISFIKSVSEGTDICKEERAAIKNLMNYYQDNQSTKRVGDFIIEKLGDSTTRKA